MADSSRNPYYVVIGVELHPWVANKCSNVVSSLMSSGENAGHWVTLPASKPVETRLALFRTVAEASHQTCLVRAIQSHWTLATTPHVLGALATNECVAVVG